MASSTSTPRASTTPAGAIRERHRVIDPAAGRKGRTRWLMVSLCFFGLTINYIDRANLGVALPSMSKDLGLSSSVEGVALGAFFATYALFQLPMGHYVDRVGERVVFAIAVAWWSVFSAATAAVQGFASLIGMRLALGAGEAGGGSARAQGGPRRVPGP